MKKLLIAGLAIASLTTGCAATSTKSSSGNREANRDWIAKRDLTELFLTKEPSVEVLSCVHKSGNDFSCQVKNHGQKVFLDVTDDGNQIYESPA